MSHDASFPRAPLAAAATLVALVLVVVGMVRIGGFTVQPPPAAPAVAERQLRFEDRPEGGVRVVDHSQGRAFATLAPGEDGFIRATLRGLVRDRKRLGIDDTEPFVLAARVDGTLTLADPATGRFVDLGAFGVTNAQAFARFIEFEGVAR